MDIQDVIDQAIEQAIRDLGGPIPARVRSYHGDTQTIACTPVVALSYRGLLVESPILRDVPVAQQYGQQGGLVVPLKPGDIVQLVVQGWDIAGWLGDGDKQTDRRFSISDLVAIPGINKSIPPEGRSDDSPVLSGDPVILGDSTAIDWVALAQKVLVELQHVKDELAVISGVFNTHVHCSSSVGYLTTTPQQIGPSAPSCDGIPAAYTPVWTPASVAAEKVKAK